MQMQTVKTFSATIWAGLREGYDGPFHTAMEAKEIAQKYVDEIGCCVSVTETTFIYTRGREPGVAVGFINYPRFPDNTDGIRAKAIELAELLMAAMGQQRVTVVMPDETVMLFK